MATEVDDERLFRWPRRDRGERRVVGAWLIALVITLGLFWQLVTYRGVIAVLAEWQFNTLGEYYPFLTYVLLTLTTFSPLVIWAMVRARRHDGNRARSEAESQPNGRSHSLVPVRLLGAGAAVALLSALCALLIAIIAPTRDRAPATIDVSDIGLIPIGEGPIAITGRTLYERTAGFDENILFFRHSGRFAPMIAPGKIVGEAPLRLFIELPADQRETDPPAIATRVGLLRKGGLPGEVIRLYRYAGFDLGDPYYVLFSSRRSLQWPMLQVAGQCGAMALLLIMSMLAIVSLRRFEVRSRRSLAGALSTD